MLLKEKFQFNRQKVEFVYSVFLIVLVPLLLIFNTLWVLNNSRRNMDAELRRKADLVNKTLSPIIADNIDNEQYLNQVISKIMLQADEIVTINVLRPEADEFKIIAADNSENLGKTFSDVQSSLVWTNNQSIAALINSQSNKQGERLWKVLTPISAKNKKVAILDTSVSIKDIDQLSNSTLRQSLIILVATVLLLLLIFINHFRFVEYAMLFRKLKELDEMKSDFLSIATHELKSPMAVISGYIDMVLEQKEAKVNEPGEKYLRKALEQTNRLSVLVADLLNVSRIEQGRIKYDYSEVKINEVIGNIIGLYSEKAKEKGLNLNYQSQDLPIIWADAGRIQEIFTNLIDNAIKYSETGEVKVYHQISANEITTTVEDSGLGMSPDAQKKLFQRFYRVKTDKTANISGTGLGLWIIKQYIENMKGEIRLESEEGKGSKFFVKFPIHKKEEPKQK